MDNNNMNDCDEFWCEYCNTKFALKRTLAKHLHTSKRCMSKRPKIHINCIWCKRTFITKDDLEKHHKKCEVDKNILYIQVLEEAKNKDKQIENMIKEKEKEIERLNNIIKDLTSKVTNTTTTNNINSVTYNNFNLKCAKPLLLSKERIIRAMDMTCEPNYIKRGQEGLADWFLNEVCRNENNDISIECTDKTRRRFRYEDENEKPKVIAGTELTDLLRSCMPTFEKTLYYRQTIDECSEDITRYDIVETLNSITDFKKPGNKFINYLVDKTHNDSVNCLLTRTR
jgi:hypothetical protein